MNHEITAVIVDNGCDKLSLEEFLMWEYEGGKGTYESSLPIGGIPFDDLPLDDKIAYMANSIIGDLDANILKFSVDVKKENHSMRYKVSPVKDKSSRGGR